MCSYGRQYKSYVEFTAAFSVVLALITQWLGKHLFKKFDFFDFMMANENFRLSETNSERIFKKYCQMKIFLASWKSVLSQSFQYFTSKSFDFFKITPVFAERSQTSFSHVFNLCMCTICINNVLSETCKLLQNDEKNL